ncbi:hypothetical protein PQQ51_02100 [Paraburkholderia xenovorans]|uniref:hypothetical protein n=1 Tax=Paraburkholderia xenovorans TaxID=36873 RepID=UPI0038B85439
MRNARTCDAALRPRPWIQEERLRWVAGLAMTCAAIALFVTAVIVAPASTRANNRLCLEQAANDAHVSLDAFFQNPANQDALVQAITLCSR